MTAIVTTQEVITSASAATASAVATQVRATVASPSQTFVASTQTKFNAASQAQVDVALTQLVLIIATTNDNLFTAKPQLYVSM